MNTNYFVLNNNTKIPKVGFGTWQIKEGEECYNSVKVALENSYRHIDTASLYANENSVGRAVRDSKIPRNELYITTKVPAHVKSYSEAVESINKSLELLNLEYIDLLLIHHPKPMDKRESTYSFDKENLEVWKAMIEAMNRGDVKSIGVSNFNVEQMKNLINNSDVTPMVNQIRYYIGHTQDEITKFCQENNILVQAYSPLATGRLLGNEKVEEIALKYNKTLPQIAIRFCLENDVLPLPKSITPNYIKANIDLDFKISKEDMDYLNSLTNLI